MTTKNRQTTHITNLAVDWLNTTTMIQQANHTPNTTTTSGDFTGSVPVTTSHYFYWMGTKNHHDDVHPVAY